MPARKAIPNPLKQRLGVVEQIYEDRPEVHRRVTAIVKEAAGVTEISESDRRPWEKWIGNLASMIGKADKRRRKGQISQAEFDKVVRQAREGFLALTRARDKKEAGRQRKGEQTIARRKERAKTLASKVSSGYEVVAPKLVGGHVGVMATPNLDAPPFPKGFEEQKRWIAENAPFQHWLGVKMGNCLQFSHLSSRANIGAKKFKIQREGGKLYAVLSKDGEPEVAIMTDGQGVIIGAEGPRYREPSGLAKRAMIQLIDKLDLRELATNPKPPRKAIQKPARVPKAPAKPLAKDLIAECRVLWESYCDRPGRMRLRKVERHCELMKNSRFKTVKDERRRCMNAVRREKKKLGM